MRDPPADPSEPRPLDRSRDLLERASGLIPRGAQTDSKAPANFVQGVAPTHVRRGKGCRVWDVDGNEYVDYAMARGPVTLGYDYEPVTEAVRAQLADGIVYSMPHPLQVEVAERVHEMVPCAEMVRFAKNGHDATTLAAKLARAHTGRDVIATQGYHGWPDVWTAGGRASAGVPDGVAEYTESFAYNDLDSLAAVFEARRGEVAGVVMNPVDAQAPEAGFLEGVRDLCDDHGALLAYDEVITGFRFAEGGAQEFFGVTPDLAAFAKGIANGMPLSAVAGRADVMRVLEDEDFVFSLTYGGDAAALAGARATLDVLREEPVVEHLFEVGDRLRDGYNEIAAERGLADRTACVGYGPRSTIEFEDRVEESLFQQECLDRGVLFAGIHLPSYSHADGDVAATLAAYEEAMAELADAVDAGAVRERLRGDPIGTSVVGST
jgi:glutamate-1-semialdehyde aminotransferase